MQNKIAFILINLFIKRLLIIFERIPINKMVVKLKTKKKGFSNFNLNHFVVFFLHILFLFHTANINH